TAAEHGGRGGGRCEAVEWIVASYSTAWGGVDLCIQRLLQTVYPFFEIIAQVEMCRQCQTWAESRVGLEMTARLPHVTARARGGRQNRQTTERYVRGLLKRPIFFGNMQEHFAQERDLQRSIEQVAANELPGLDVLDVEFDAVAGVVRVFIDHPDGVD